MPRDIFILGCGRSGTSLVAGLFRSSGYFQGTRFYRPRDSNPRGFFEDAEVNDINESILQPLLPSRTTHRGIAYSGDSPGLGQRWLARIPVGADVPLAPQTGERIAAVLNHRPFCLKDPRFGYTLHLWRAQAPAARMICVFREPRVVVASIVKEIVTAPYLEDFALSTKEAFEVWRLLYSHILERHAQSGDWLFVDYADLFKPSVLDRIGQFCEASIDRSFPDPELNRSTAVPSVDPSAESLYAELTARSKATLDNIGGGPLKCRN